MTIETPRFRLGFLTHVQGRGDDPRRSYRNAQELFVAADELGFDVGWVAQHHVSQGGGGLSSPWTFLAHAAARTRRIRLGTAVTVLPLEDPVRLAEDVSTVDALSDGRVEIGVGSGSDEVEYAATDLITQFNPAVPDHDAALRALELIATQVAPALGWKPSTGTPPDPTPAGA
ncbi:LLM class flavin-dependent oxidoreductase [Streptomyces sp. NBC_00513]|uniref:LLM class flavin-dependent oxidoreductase n=1 Tax=unclassified Streptomyces TaxID=2593676 RepID=UPI002255BFA4|nr:LLM class flavin-dependent oxidoreductase [Streptomyces sp. NBC_00424]MCX5071328.1 LLM class flavin-dependent oxidoreductase [Streptomyces sp. NBC_00424]WUD45258.1 LLM class flavin-dependent oxidoreductase [Streptomyces sp. NBC_00513]